MKIKVWGEYALFTRPECKAEPLTYLCLTPTAAIGILDAIYWKPGVDYLIRKITALNPIKTTTIKMNNLRNKISPDHILGWQQNNGVGGYFISNDRTQRNYTILKDVAYIIEFEPIAVDTSVNLDRFIEILSMRITKGQCFSQPFLGIREFVAYFEWANEDEKSQLENTEINLGALPVALEYVSTQNKSGIWIKTGVSMEWCLTEVKPRFENFVLKDGVLSKVQ